MIGWNLTGLCSGGATLGLLRYSYNVHTVMITVNSETLTERLINLAGFLYDPALEVLPPVVPTNSTLLNTTVTPTSAP